MRSERGIAGVAAARGMVSGRRCAAVAGLFLVLACTCVDELDAFAPHTLFPGLRHGTRTHFAHPSHPTPPALVLRHDGGSLRGSACRMVASPLAQSGDAATSAIIKEYTQADLPRLYDTAGRFDAKTAFQDRIDSIHGLWDQMCLVCPDHVALNDPIHDGGVKMTYRDAAARITLLAGGLQALGVCKGDKIGLFAENSYRWALIDGAVLKAGAVDVVRGALGPVSELAFILRDSDSKACIVQDATLLQSMATEMGSTLSLPQTGFIIVMDAGGLSGEDIKHKCGMSGKNSLRVYTMEELAMLGGGGVLSSSSQPSFSSVPVDRDDMATLLYTSGTSGNVFFACSQRGRCGFVYQCPDFHNLWHIPWASRHDTLASVHSCLFASVPVSPCACETVSVCTLCTHAGSRTHVQARAHTHIHTYTGKPKGVTLSHGNLLHQMLDNSYAARAPVICVCVVFCVFVLDQTDAVHHTDPLRCVCENSHAAHVCSWSQVPATYSCASCHVGTSLSALLSTMRSCAGQLWSTPVSRPLRRISRATRPRCATNTLVSARTRTHAHIHTQTLRTQPLPPHTQVIIAVPRLYESIQQGVLLKFAAGSVVQRAIVAAVMWVSRTHMLARRCAEGREAVATLAEQEVWQRKAPLVHSARRVLARAVAALLGPLQKLGDKLVWAKVRAGLGGRIKCLVSGGSKLPVALDDFFEMAGVNIIVGYGLTETSPVISNRMVEANVAGSCGKPPAKTELLIKDSESGAELGRVGGGGEPWTHLTTAHSSGEIGVVWARGPQITKGYYKNPEANDAAFDSEGFFNTGDLGRVDPVTGCLFITGRAKDTIVLMNGENVEPEPLEEVLVESPLISQAMLVGQDEKTLAALVVLNVEGCAAAGLLDADTAAELAPLLPAGPKDPTPDRAALEAARVRLAKSHPELLRAVLAEANELIATKGVFREWERIGDVALLLEPFTVDNGLLTMTLKMKRDAVVAQYQGLVDALFRR